MLIFYDVIMDGSYKEVYEQDDSPMPSLRRYSAELYTKERIPPLSIKKVFNSFQVSNYVLSKF